MGGHPKHTRTKTKENHKQYDKVVIPWLTRISKSSPGQQGLERLRVKSGASDEPAEEKSHNEREGNVTASFVEVPGEEEEKFSEGAQRPVTADCMSGRTNLTGKARKGPKAMVNTWRGSLLAEKTGGKKRD